MNTGSARLMIPVFNLLALVAVGCPTAHTSSVPEAGITQVSFDFSKIDEGVTKEFMKAWNYSRNGIDNVEAVVLIFGKVDGSYFATALGQTNEINKVNFRPDPAAIAIAHTHPTNLDPKPSIEDMRVGDRFGVPIFTITRWGMFMYDPNTRRVTKIQHNLDWLDAAKWRQAHQSISSK